MEPQCYRDQLEKIFAAAVNRVDPQRMITDYLSLKGDLLTVSLPGAFREVNLREYRRVLVLGAGKAAAKMAKALEGLLGDRIDDGFISVKPGHTEPLKIIRTNEGGHPVPDEQSQASAREVERLAEEADESTLVINLISGGGSALLCSPYADGHFSLSLKEKRKTTELLLACGANIREINCVRKHLSGIKGGRLAARLAPAASLNLILSDVIGDSLSAIASGLTAADPTTFADAAAVFDKYQLWDRVPGEAAKILRAGQEGKIQDTPKPGDPRLGKAANILIGTNRDALVTAAETARALGYHTAALTARLSGEARLAADFLWSIARDTRDHGLLVQPPACIITGGETTVTLTGEGRGGRNQEMALALLSRMLEDPDDSRGIYFLSAGTDGNDGPTDAAGAFADEELTSRALSSGLKASAYLADNDSYRFFNTLGGLLKTGPTNTNVSDLQIMLIP